MDEHQQTLDQFQAQSEYLRKLNQQIVQKDNIIKLLQLQIKTLEEQADHGSEALVERLRGDVERKDEDLRRLRALLDRTELRNRSLVERDEATAEVEALQTRLREREAELDEARRRGQAGEREAEDLRHRLREREDELIDAIAEIEALRGGAAVAPAGDAHGTEADRLRIAELERALDEALRGGGDPVEDGVEIETARRAEERARSEAEVLRREVAELRARLDEMRAEAREALDPEGFQVVHEVVELSERVEALGRSLGGDLRVEETWRGVWDCLVRLRESFGVRLVPTTGQVYDPERHQAVEIVFSSEAAHDQVIEEISQGYMLAGAVVKPADVVVSRNPYYCADCRRVVASGSRFCNLCGARVPGEDARGSGSRDVAAPSGGGRVDRARALERTGELEGARALYEGLLAEDPEDRKALDGLARVAEGQGRFDEALGHLDVLAGLPGVPAELGARRDRLQAKLEIVERLQRLL